MGGGGLDVGVVWRWVFEIESKENKCWFRRKGQYFWKWCYRSLWYKTVHINTCLILIGYRDRAVWISRTKLDFCLWSWMKREVFKLKVETADELLARILDAAAYRTQTNSTRSSHTSCKVHTSWRWDFRTFIVKCNRIVVAVSTDLPFKQNY
jgi:hypothetical protein